MVIREDITLQALALAVGNIIGKAFVILAKLRLRLGMEDDCRTGSTLREIILQQQQCALLHIRKQLSTRGHTLCHQLRLLAALHSLYTDIINLTQNIVGIVKPIGSPLADKRCKGAIAALRTVDISDNIYTLQLVGRELICNLKTAQRLHLVIKEVQTIWSALGVREYIHDTSSNRVLTRLIDKIHTHKALIFQLFDKVRDIYSIATRNLYLLLLKRLTCHNLLGNGIGICADDKVFTRSKTLDGIHRICTHHDTLGILTTVEYRAFIGGREEEHTLLVKQCVEVIHSVCRRIAILCHKYMQTGSFCHRCCQIKRKGSSD